MKIFVKTITIIYWESDEAKHEMCSLVKTNTHRMLQPIWKQSGSFSNSKEILHVRFTI